MKRQTPLIPLFLIFLFLAIGMFFLAQTGALRGVNGFFEQLTVPLQRMVFGVFNQEQTKTEAEKLRQENRELLVQLAKQKELEKENRALHDQFETTTPASQDLLPAQIIGRNEDKLVIDKGESDGVKVGQVVVYQNNLVGKVVTVSKHISIVALVTQQSITFTAQTVKTESLGIAKGNGADLLVLDNVVLSDKLEKGDLVVTTGDIDEKGHGFPPDLVVGKIISLNKKASALFQTAEVRMLINTTKLRMVFVLKTN